MAEFLTTTGTSHHLENLIIDSKKKLVLISPYLQLSKTFHQRLKDASNRGVQITIIYGKDELKPNERNSLAELKTVHLYYFQNLHAKCYFNEEKMIITSMNMYEFSEKNNREMGVLIDRLTDKQLFDKAVAETGSILDSADKQELRRVDRQSKKTNSNERPEPKYIRGYCIRCEARIPYNPGKPLCAECYSIWSKHENFEYPENVCHRCGEYETTTMAKPQCYNCYTLSEYENDTPIKGDSIDKFHTELVKKYPKNEINKTDTYVYFNKVISGVDAMIFPDKVIVKLSRKANEGRINEIEKFVHLKLNSWRIVEEDSSNYAKNITLALKNKDAEEVVSIISMFKSSSFNY